jgi:hypothetical protein
VSAPDLVSRVDFGRFDGTKVSRTPQGGLKVPAALTREGVFMYRNADGSTRREYRPADEVFNTDALSSLEDAPVTDLHPTEMVSAKNHGTLAKGHVRDIKQDGRFVMATMLVQDAGLIAAIDRGERKEISCGYTCKLDMTPGVSPAGEAYDAIQRGITYNHAALLPVGAGRAGREVALRLDAAFQDDTQAPAPAEKVITVIKITFDGKEYVKGSDEHLAAIDAKTAADLAASKAETKAAAERADKVEADLKAAAARVDALEAPAKKAAREKLEAAAKKALGKSEEKLDGKTDEELRALIVAAALEPQAERADNTGAARIAAALATGSIVSTSAAAPAAPAPKPWEQPLAASKK